MHGQLCSLLFYLLICFYADGEPVLERGITILHIPHFQHSQQSHPSCMKWGGTRMKPGWSEAIPKYGAQEMEPPEMPWKVILVWFQSSLWNVQLCRWNMNLLLFQIQGNIKMQSTWALFHLYDLNIAIHQSLYQASLWIITHIFCQSHWSNINRKCKVGFYIDCCRTSTNSES